MDGGSPKQENWVNLKVQPWQRRQEGANTLGFGRLSSFLSNILGLGSGRFSPPGGSFRIVLGYLEEFPSMRMDKKWVVKATLELV
ncbi:hypothetical protein DUI87_22164 [Hirundo rustica rustica]|uniref:Uncharacterized protein n=1 Tax=Hirundo rustica rustica TaxID=333673 RepID=A0A3M0JKJ4_HIRRU|nr:hypothetical protein DUI87_22164 [Hirundo rustica rustica]